MRKMDRVLFVIDTEGKILQTTYEDDVMKLEEFGLGTNALVFAKELSDKGNNVLLVEQGETPYISALVLEGIVDKDDIIEKKEYKSSFGFTVVWEIEKELVPNLGKEVRYNWMITVKLRS